MPDQVNQAETPAPEARSRRNSRRGFLRTAGGVAAGTAMLISGCDFDGSDGEMPEPEADVTLDFSQPADVLNYAYALEQLEAAFYAEVAANLYSDASDEERAYFDDLAAHEAIHRDFFATAIPSQFGEDALIPDLSVDFSGIDFSSRASVLGTAQQLEDLGVSAYNGAGIYLAGNATLLTLAGKIVSVEARHASAIRALNGSESDSIDLASLTDLGANTDFSLGVSQAPGDVLAAVADTGLVTTTIEATNT